MPFNNGTPERIRTSDPRYRKPILYPAELRARVSIFYAYLLEHPSSKPATVPT